MNQCQSHRFHNDIDASDKSPKIAGSDPSKAETCSEIWYVDWNGMTYQMQAV